MKHESIERKQAKRKKDATRSIVVFAAIQIVTAVILVGLCLIPEIPTGMVVFLLVLAGLDLLMILPAMCVLKERMKEIEGGELDAAGKY